MASRIVAIPKDLPVDPPLSEPLPEPQLEFRAAVPVAEEPPPPPLPKPRPKPKHDRIGDILRAARLERGDDLYLIAEYLCIKPAFLIALESSRYEELPADAYVIGFLRTYANFLGIDGREAVDRYRYEMAGRRKKPVLSMPTPVSEGRAPSGIIMVGATIVLLIIYGLWYGFSSSNRADHTPPAVPAAAQALPQTIDPAGAAGLTAPLAPSMPATVAPPPAPAATPAPAPSPESLAIPPVPAPTAAPPAAAVPADKPQESAPSPDTDKKGQVFGDEKPSRLLIRATQNTWIMVVDPTGKAVFDRVLKPGESYKVPDIPNLSLTTGNGNGIILSLDGNDLPKVASGAPRLIRNISLDPARLMAMTKPDR